MPSACRLRIPPASDHVQQRTTADRLTALVTPADCGAGQGDALHAQTRSATYAKALEQLRRYAALDGVPVLIEGETGTGKSWFARMLHAWSLRARRAYYHVNLAALDDAIASSDLFGRLSGAFTGASQRRAGYFASADGGTLFLDEIGQTSLAIQRKLLHAIEYGEVWPVGADRAIRVDVRIVAATNRPAATLVQEERMLHDLLPRLAAFRIRIPPLARALVTRDAARFGGYASAPALSAALERRLEHEPWPGNVRQLEGVMRRVLVDACGERTLGAALLDDAVGDTPWLDTPTETTPVASHRRADAPVAVAIDVESAMRDGVPKAELARQLGISRATLYRRISRADADAPSPAPVEADAAPSYLLSQLPSHETSQRTD
jgi:DNA-binding NtrC family response regulator